MAYGIEIKNASDQVIMTFTSRKGRFAANGTTGTVPADGYVDVYVSGMENDDSWSVFVQDHYELEMFVPSSYGLQKYSGLFRITNLNGYYPVSYSYWVTKT